MQLPDNLTEWTRRLVQNYSYDKAMRMLQQHGYNVREIHRHGDKALILIDNSGVEERVFIDVVPTHGTRHTRNGDWRKKFSYVWRPGVAKRKVVRDGKGLFAKAPKWWEEFLKLDGWKSEYGSVQNVLNQIIRNAGRQEYASEASREQNCIAIAKFCKHYNIDPDNACKMDRMQLSFMVQSFCDQWMKEGKAVTAENRRSSLKRFFELNGYVIENQKALVLQSYNTSAGNHMEEYVPSRQEVHAMANSCGQTLQGLRDRAVILFSHLTGCRSADTRAMQFGVDYHLKVGNQVVVFNIKNQLQSWDGRSPIVVPVTLELKKIVNSACKKGREHFKLLHPLGVEALLAYLRERMNVYGCIADDEVLFPLHKGGLEEDRTRPMGESTLSKIFKKAARIALKHCVQCRKNSSCDQCDQCERWRGVHPHVMKDTFLQVLDSGDAVTQAQILSDNDKKFLMGHKQEGSMDHYFRNGVMQRLEELKSKYMRLAWEEKPADGSHVEMRKRQILDMATFFNAPPEVIRSLERTMSEWQEYRDFDMQLIRRLLSGEQINECELIKNGYAVEDLGNHVRVVKNSSEIRSDNGQRGIAARQPNKERIVIDATEVEQMLNQGYTPIFNLPNGRVVLEKESI